MRILRPSAWILSAHVLCGLALTAVTCLAAPTAARAEPDLFLREYDVGPPQVQAGGRLTISGDVYNGDPNDVAPGTLTAGRDGYMVDLVLSSDEVVRAGFATYSENYREDVLLRGGRMSRTTDATFYEWYSFASDRFVVPADTPPGDYFACAVADPGQRIAESNEGNNTICAPVRVVAGPPPAPARLDFEGRVTRVRDECRDGRSLTHVSVAVTNVSDVAFVPDERNPELLYRNFVELNGEVYPTGTIHVQHEVGPGRGSNVGFVVHNIAYDKLYGRRVILGVNVDPDNDLAEADETNNIGRMEYVLPPLDCG